MRVRWLRAALRSLDELGAYVARDDPAAAARLVSRIDEAVAKLASHPAMGRPGRIAGTRELVISGTPYIVPYRVRGDDVEVLRVLHGAQQWPSADLLRAMRSPGPAAPRRSPSPPRRRSSATPPRSRDR